MPETVKKGDQFIYDPDPKRPLFIQVNRVARDGSWADVIVLNWAASWAKRQPTPIPGRRAAWDLDLVNSFIPED